MILSVSVCLFDTIVRTGRTLARKKCKKITCRFWHLQSNGVIAKIVLQDIDLLLEGKNWYVSISKLLRAVANRRLLCHLRLRVIKGNLNPISSSRIPKVLISGNHYGGLVGWMAGTIKGERGPVGRVGFSSICSLCIVFGAFRTFTHPFIFSLSNTVWIVCLIEQLPESIPCVGWSLYRSRDSLWYSRYLQPSTW